MIDNKTVSADSILFGDKFPQAILRAHALLSREAMSYDTQLKDILHDPVIASSVSDCSIFPSIVDAVCATHALHAVFFFENLNRIFKEDQRLIPSRPMALVIGLFRGFRFYEHRDVHARSYLSELENLLVLLCFHQNWIDELPVTSQKQKTMLSEEIAKFMNPEDSATKGERRAWVSNVLVEIKVRQVTLQAQEHLPKFGPFAETLINELAYKLFGALSVHGRLEAMIALHQRITEQKII